jgi:two-component system cell cycle response regulator
MSNQLTAENLQLRNQLKDLLDQAHRNQQILQRHQMLDLKFIEAETFGDLVESIFQTYLESSELDVVTLSLLDPDYEIRRILADLNIDLRKFPNLFFLQSKAELGELHDRLVKPVLGRYSEQLYGPMFPEPVITPASVAIVPLLRHDRLIGCLNLGSLQEPRFVADTATDFLEHRASIVAICIENVINKELLKYIGLMDPLTRVNNRRYVEHRLIEEVMRTCRQGYALSCMYIDIDHFKHINDKVGHQGGDEVLREVAARIKTELRLNDALGRFGGEEFVVLLIDAELVDARCVAERIRAGIAEQPITATSGVNLSVTVSIGIATLTGPNRSEDAKTIGQNFLARADQALYQAKAGGRNRVVSIG